MTKISKKSAKTTKATTKTTKGEKAPKQEQLFKGQVPAQKVFVADLKGFTKKLGNFCPAKKWLILSGETVTFANTYNEQQIPKSSYDPSTYTYEYKPKVHDPKMEEMTEVEVDEWPPFVTSARRRKASK